MPRLFQRPDELPEVSNLSKVSTTVEAIPDLIQDTQRCFMKLVVSPTNRQPAPPEEGVEPNLPYGITKSSKLQPRILPLVERKLTRCMSRHHDCGTIPRDTDTIGVGSQILRLSESASRNSSLNNSVTLSSSHPLLLHSRCQSWSSCQSTNLLLC